MLAKSCILWGFLLSVAILLTAGSSYAQGALSSETYDLNFSKGLAEFESRRYDSAEKFFRKALEAKPGDPQATFYLGQTLTRAQKYGEAEAVFRKLLQMQPGSGRAYLGLGIVLYNQERYREALDSLALAEKASPNEALVYYYQGLSHFKLAAYQQMPPRFLRAMTLGPDLSSSAHYYSGLAYYQQGILDEARAEFEEAQILQPESEFGKSAAAYLEQIKTGAPIQQRKRWDLTFSVSSQWDDNVVLLPSGFSPPAGSTGISRSSDYRTALYLRGEARAFEQGPFVAGASYALYQSFHRTLSAFDVESHTPTVFVQHTTGHVRVGYTYDKYITAGKDVSLAGTASAADWAYRGHKASVGVSLPPFYKIILDAGFDYYVQLYDNANSFSPLGDVFREDKVYNYSATAMRRLTDHFSLGLQYVHTDDNSNIAAFKYKRNIYGLVLTGQF